MHELTIREVLTVCEIEARCGADGPTQIGVRLETLPPTSGKAGSSR